MGATDVITLNRILTSAAGLRASDLHLVVGTQPTIRVDGQLSSMADEPIVTVDFLESVAGTLLNDQQRATLNEKKEVVAAVSLNAQLRFKITVFLQRGSLAINMHFIGTAPISLSDLGLPDPVKSLVQLQKGLIIVSGPYGSGKSTTLKAFIHEINNSRTANIVTIEDPVEQLYVNNQSIIEQREVGRDVTSFEQGIVSASREDVDVIVASEMRRPEVITAVLEAAEASRLVLTTMSSDSVLATLEQIITGVPTSDVNKVRSQLSNVLVGIISQRLIAKSGGGQVMVPDILIPTPPVRSVLRDGAMTQLQNVVMTSRVEGIQSFDRLLLQLVNDGTISLEEAIRHAQEPNVFRNIRH